MKLRALGLALAVTCMVAVSAPARAQFGPMPPGGPMLPGGAMPPGGGGGLPMPPGAALPPGAMPPGVAMPPPGMYSPADRAMMGGYPGMQPVMPYGGPVDGGGGGCGAPYGYGAPCGRESCGCESCGCPPCGCECGCECCEEGCLDFGRGGGCNCGCGCEPDGTPHWRARLEFLLLQFQRPDEPQTLATLAGASVLGIDSLDFDNELNSRLALEARLPNNSSIELVFFGFGHWSESATVTGALQSVYQTLAGGNAVPYDNSSEQDISYSSNLYNLEVNYWAPVINARHFQASLLVGGRYLNISETFDYNATATVAGATVLGNTRINAHNNIAALQTGAMAWLPLNHCFSARFDAKADVGYNFAEQSTDITVRGSNTAAQNITYGESIDSDKGAFLLELTGVLRWQWNCHLAAYVGYEALWVNDLVLAPEQFNRIFPSTGVRPVLIDDTGRRVYHGALAGLEITW